MPKKPTNLIYGVDDEPHLTTTLLLGFQHIFVLSIAFIFPVERKLAGAGIEGAAKTVPAKISHDRMGFSIPLFDRKLSNDARIQLQFEP